MPGYQCGQCDGAEPAVVLVTPLSGGDTLAIGENCLPVTWCAMFAGATGLDPEALWDAAIALAEAPGGDEDQAATGPGTGPPGGPDGDSTPAGPPDKPDPAPAAKPARARPRTSTPHASRARRPAQ